MLKFGLDEAGYTTKAGTPRTTLTPGEQEWHRQNNTCEQCQSLFFVRGG
jgi:hypothetical protein